MSESEKFELVFEGPADDSPGTLRKLRTSLLADLGLSVEEAQDALNNAPKVLKVSEVEEELKPLYSALKRAGARVLIVHPVSEESQSNEKAYFLDLEGDQIDEELIRSLESLPGEEEPPAEPDIAPAVDLTKEFAETEALPQVLEQAPAPTETKPELEPIFDLSIGEDLAAPPIERQVDEAIPVPTDESPPATKNLFEFDEPAEAATNKPAPVEMEAIKSIAEPALPLFEFDSAPHPEPQEEAAPKSGASSLSLEDLTVSADPELEKAPASKSKSQGITLALGDDDLSASLADQIKAETPAPPKPAAKKLEGIALDIEEEKVDPAQKSQPEKKASLPPVASLYPEPGAGPLATPKVADPEPEQAPPAAAEYRPSKVGSAVGMDIVAPILVGAIILGVANWIYFSSGNRTANLPEISFPEDAPAKISERQRLRGPISSSESAITRSKVGSGYSLEWTVIIDQGSFKRTSFEVTTPPPPELSPTQVVRGERPLPWLRKIEVMNLSFEKLADGSWVANGPARLFIEQGLNKRRLVGETTVTLNKDATLSSTDARIVIKRNAQESKDKNPPEYSLEQLPNGDLRLLFAVKLEG